MGGKAGMAKTRTKKERLDEDLPLWSQLGEKWHAQWEQKSTKALCGAPTTQDEKCYDMYDPTPGNEICNACLRVLSEFQSRSG